MGSNSGIRFVITFRGSGLAAEPMKLIQVQFSHAAGQRAVRCAAITHIAALLRQLRVVRTVTKPENAVAQVDMCTEYGFYRASYATAVYALIVCPSVRLSVTSRSSTKAAKPRITQATPYDSPGTLVF